MKNAKHLLLEDEFMLLVLIYNCFGIDIETLNEFGCYNTEEKLNKLIDGLIIKKMISIEGIYIVIIDGTILKLLKYRFTIDMSQ